MSELVEWLRAIATEKTAICPSVKIHTAQWLAANEIESLQRQVAELKEENDRVLMANRECNNWYNQLREDHKRLTAMLSAQQFEEQAKAIHLMTAIGDTQETFGRALDCVATSGCKVGIEQIIATPQSLPEVK